MTYSTRRSLAVLILSMLASLTTACGNKDADTDQGDTALKQTELRQNTYVSGTNTSLQSGYFKIKLTKPTTWTLAEEKVAYELMGVGVDFVAGDDETLQREMAIAHKKNLVLFVISENPMGAAVEFNPSLMGLAENITMSPGIVTGEDYFFHSKKLAARANVPITYADTYTKREIGGVEFSVMAAKVTAPGAENVQQSYFAARHNDHMIIIIQSYATDAQRQALDGILNSISLGW